MKLTAAFAPSLLAVTLSAATAAHADTIAWANWNFPAVALSTPGVPGTVTGTIGAINVTYTGQNYNPTLTASFLPTSSFTGGTIGNGPAGLDSIIVMGGESYTESIQFSSPVTDPTIAIWSLGASGTPATFVFGPNQPFSIEAGGPSAEYGGSSITQSNTQAGETVYGEEGNGVIQFQGTYSELTFTTPDYEDYYTFTVGYDTDPSATANSPEPGTLSLIGLGIGALPILRRRLLRK